jgi:hypothetical protein
LEKLSGPKVADFFFLKMDKGSLTGKQRNFFSLYFLVLHLPQENLFHDNLEEKLPTGESYCPGCQGNFHNLEVTHQAVILKIS